MIKKSAKISHYKIINQIITKFTFINVYFLQIDFYMLETTIFNVMKDYLGLEKDL